MTNFNFLSKFNNWLGELSSRMSLVGVSCDASGAQVAREAIEAHRRVSGGQSRSKCAAQVRKANIELLKAEWMKCAAAIMLVLTIGVGEVWGATNTTTFKNFSSGTWASNKNPLPCETGGWSWASSATPNSFESSGSARGLQWSSATSTTLTTTQTGTITEVSIVASTNGTVSLSVSVGGTAFKNGNNTSLSVSGNNSTYTFSGSSTGEISISVNNTYKSAYVKSITITYSTGTSKTLVLLGIGFWVG